MIEIQETKQISTIREHIISFILDNKYELNFVVKEEDGYIFEYWQSHNPGDPKYIHANKLTNEQRMEIDTFIHEFKF